jgi:(S)-2-hydroxyglutarate dehydrogenase
MTAYCEAKKIPLNRCGKLVVAKGQDDLPQLDELLRRGQANGVPLESLTEEEARKIEPRVKTHQRAIFSPTTTSADPQRVIEEMTRDAKQEGITIRTAAPYLRTEKGLVMTPQGSFTANHVVNAAGLYADKIALDFGFSERYRILPFKGLYLYWHIGRQFFNRRTHLIPALRI